MLPESFRKPKRAEPEEREERVAEHKRYKLGHINQSEKGIEPGN